MKLGILCNSFGNSGGMETFTLDLVESLIPYLEENPIVISKHFNPKNPLTAKVKKIPVNVSWVPRLFKDIYFSWKVKNIKKSMNIDVLVGCCRCIESDVVVCGGTHIGFCKMKGRLSLYDKITADLEKRQNQNAKLIIAHSFLMKEELEKYYSVPSEKIEVIYPPVSLSRFHPLPQSEKNKVREQLGLTDNLKYFLFVSSSHKRKGFDLLKRYFSKTDLPIKLLVVGRPIGNTGSTKIEYCGFSDNISKYYQASDFTILASKYEPFGLAPLESLACGTPVVISEKLGCNEVIQPEYKFSFNPENLESLDKAIRNALSSSSKLLEKHYPFKEDLSSSHHIKKFIKTLSKRLKLFKIAEGNN